MLHHVDGTFDMFDSRSCSGLSTKYFSQLCL
jgi:hypothetical protein